VIRRQPTADAFDALVTAAANDPNPALAAHQCRTST